MKNPEADLQRTIVGWLAGEEWLGRLRYFHVPNGGKRGVVTAMNMKRIGVRAGVPDLVILSSDGRAMFCELKGPKGSMNGAQKDWRAWLETRFPWHEIRSLDEMKKAVLGFLL